MVPIKTDDRVVRKALTQIASENTSIVHQVPAHEPQIRLADFQEKGTVYEIRFWTNQKFEVDNIKSDLRWAAQEKLREYMSEDYMNT
jgi:small-conductance mechanosensitive channel